MATRNGCPLKDAGLPAPIWRDPDPPGPVHTPWSLVVPESGKGDWRAAGGSTPAHRRCRRRDCPEEHAGMRCGDRRRRGDSQLGLGMYEEGGYTMPDCRTAAHCQGLGIFLESNPDSPSHALARRRRVDSRPAAGMCLLLCAFASGFVGSAGAVGVRNGDGDGIAMEP
eukprot:gene15294-biopygen2816